MVDSHGMNNAAWTIAVSMDESLLGKGVQNLNLGLLKQTLHEFKVS